MGKFVKVAGIVWASLGGLSLVSLAAYGSEFGASRILAGSTVLIMFVAPGVLLAIKGHRMIDQEDREWIASLPKSEPASLASPGLEARRERACPWCAEQILEQARVCKHCGRDVRPRELEIDA
jgi:hypothetical protein